MHLARLSQSASRALPHLLSPSLQYPSCCNYPIKLSRIFYRISFVLTINTPDTVVNAIRSKMYDSWSCKKLA